MENLSVTPEYLEQLATILDESTDLAQHAKQTTTDIPTETETTWGAFYGDTSKAFRAAEQERHQAVRSLKEACTKVAEWLRTTATNYTNCDTLASENLDKQMLNH